MSKEPARTLGRWRSADKEADIFYRDDAGRWWCKTLEATDDDILLVSKLKQDVVATRPTAAMLEQDGWVPTANPFIFRTPSGRPTPTDDKWAAVDEASMAFTGRQFLHALEAAKKHPALKNWQACACPSEIIRDLLQMLDEATGRQNIGGRP